MVSIIITCEHGGNRVPAKYRALFKGYEHLLNTHQGYDPGALELAKIIAKECNNPLCFETITRLLVEQNRSRFHSNLFSVVTRDLPDTIQQEIMEEIYDPYHNEVESVIAKLLKKGKVLHLSIHSFTPELNGEVRDCDIGLLYDRTRKMEKDFCLELQKNVFKAYPGLKVRRNYPYSGGSDGFTTVLRKKIPENRYFGIEIENNQKHVLSNSAEWKFIKQNFARLVQYSMGVLK